MSDYREIPKNTEMQKLLDELLSRHPKIVQTEGCMGGQPRLDGYRLRVVDFLAHIAACDHSPSETAADWDYPNNEGFTPEDVKDVVRYAHDVVALVWDKANGRDYTSRG